MTHVNRSRLLAAALFATAGAASHPGAAGIEMPRVIADPFAFSSAPAAASMPATFGGPGNQRRRRKREKWFMSHDRRRKGRVR